MLSFYRSGSGKTSVIVELEKLGHVIIHEAATDVIALEQDRYINGSSCVFLKKMFKQDKLSRI